MTEFSVSPFRGHEKFRIPQKKERQAEFERIEKLAIAAREGGKEIVVVMGMGFVGAVMAAVIADTVDKKTRKCSKFVIGCDLPTKQSYWKIPTINSGRSPVKAEDQKVERTIRRCVKKKNTLVATYNNKCLSLADCVVVAVQCDYIKPEFGNMRTGRVKISPLKRLIRIIGKEIPARCLVMIVTTVPPGTTECVAWPIMKEAFKARRIKSPPLLAHGFERVTPGKEYIASIRHFRHVCSGCTPAARTRVKKFLKEVLNNQDHPLTVMARPIESETTKIVENSYRATILAFMHEWSIFAERNGVDLIKVIKAIRVRDTHNNIIFPGPGIGGYCLPKDGGLGYWAYKHILRLKDRDSVFKMSTTAIDINDTRGLHAARLVRDALHDMGRKVAGSEVLLCGASYREGVSDTRNSGSEIVVRKLVQMGAKIRVHDPYVDHWREIENQDSHPGSGQSRSRFFRHQKKLAHVRVQKNLRRAAKGVKAVILAVRHSPYRRLRPDQLVRWAGGPIALVDCFNILSDRKIRRYFELGCEVKALGKGHIQRIKEKVQAKEK